MVCGRFRKHSIVSMAIQLIYLLEQLIHILPLTKKKTQCLPMQMYPSYNKIRKSPLSQIKIKKYKKISKVTQHCNMAPLSPTILGALGDSDGNFVIYITEWPQFWPQFLLLMQYSLTLGSTKFSLISATIKTYYFLQKHVQKLASHAAEREYNFL